MPMVRPLMPRAPMPARARLLRQAGAAALHTAPHASAAVAARPWRPANLDGGHKTINHTGIDVYILFPELDDTPPSVLKWVRSKSA